MKEKARKSAYDRTNFEDAKYGVVYLAGECIPDSALPADESEPVFILRAQDDLAVHTLVRYKNTAQQIEDSSLRPSEEWFASLDKVIESFAAWRRNHTVKVPD